MKKLLVILIGAIVGGALSAPAQSRNRSAAAGLPGAPATGDYASDVDVIVQAEGQALEQARQLLEEDAKGTDKAALQTAIKEMERSQAALADAKKSPDKLSTALAAAEAAYQALLKAVPREYRMARSRNSRGQSRGSGQPSQQEMNQLDSGTNDNRYETESQAAADPTKQQREQSETLDRLKQLSRRQQDLNDRLRDLQNSLQEAHTDQEREDIQRQLKRLRDEERQMLADVDELRQKMDQSPDASRQADTRQQLGQTRTDVQRAAQELENQSVSQALAAGARAEQNMQNLRDKIRRQSSSQFGGQMRQMRSQARDLADKEKQISHDLDALNNTDQKTLDDSAQRQSLVDQLNHQQSALTNLLEQMRNVTEQAETSEPLLSKQLYDTLRRADQQHTDNQLAVGAQLVDRGFLPQASQAEHAASQNIDDLRKGVDRAAESVLGSETDALRYAQKELDDLAKQIAGEMAAGTNSTNSGAGQMVRGQRGTNSPASAGNGRASQSGDSSGDAQASANRESASTDAPTQPGDNQNSQPGSQSAPGQSVGGNRPGKNPATTGAGQSSQSASANGNNPAPGQANNAQPSASTGGQAGAGGAANEREQLRQFAEQLGGAHGNGGLNNGPITGNNYIDWTDRLRDVEQALDSPDLRNQLATVRERVGVYRRAYREERAFPTQADLQDKVIGPLTQARNWVAQELARAQNDRSLVPLDRDPVQEKYSDLVRQYYEKLGSPQ